MQHRSDVIADLKARGTLKDVTHADLGAQLMAGEPWTVYCGFDPTADSLHIGNLVSLMALRRFQLAGHRVIAVAGGATGMIGDPSGRSSERNLLDEATLARNVEGIRADMGRVLELDGENPARVLNNADWVRPLTVVEFLRDVGKHFRVNVMIQKDSVRDRLEREEGISFTEFSYMLIQAFDFLHLAENHGCRLQIGGSDQWGNIVAGTDLIRRKLGDDAVVAGATLELLLDAAGQKFGKSTGGGSLWMSPARTSPFRLYQHMLNTADAGDDPAEQEVARYLRVFTLLPVEEIAALMAEHNPARQHRLAQRRLAEEVVRMLHGEAGLQAAEQATSAIFGGGDVAAVPDAVLLSAFEDVDLRAEFPRDRLTSSEGIPVIEAVAEAGLAKSKGEARKKIVEGGVTLNNVKVTDKAAAITSDGIGGRPVCILGLGKQRRAIVRFV